MTVMTVKEAMGVMSVTVMPTTHFTAIMTAVVSGP